MAQYSLREYSTKIAALIQDGQIEEAIAHTRHILSHYPRYLPAYGLLARASMEKGDFSHASHYFQTILSVNPEDAQAWMNLAQLSDDLGEIEQAAWYMERAFEIEPGNSRIREHLRQLYSQRDGVDRARIKLTPAALARTQTRSGSFRRASQKLQRLLRTEANLPPLQAASLEATLAKALWNQSDKASQVDEVCGSLLQKLPRCIQANLIRAQILSSTGQSEEAAPYLDVARELDPEGEYAFRMLGPKSPLPQTRVEIPYLDYQPAQAEPQEPALEELEDTSWLDEIGQDVLPPADKEQAPEDAVSADIGLQTQPLRSPQATASQPDLTEPEQPEEAAETELAVPAWLREIQQEGTQDAETQEDLAWLQESEPKEPAEPSLSTTPPPLPTDDVPDWLDGLRPMQEGPDQAEPEPDTEKEQTMVGQVPDWLLHLDQEAETQQDEPKETEPPDADQEPEPEAPDWLQQLVPADKEAAPGPLETVPPEAPSEPELAVEQEPEWTELGLSDDPERPAWLQELQTEILGAAPAAPITQPLDQLAPVPASLEEPQPAESDQDEEQPYEWLAELGVPEMPEEELVLESTPEEEQPGISEEELPLEPTPEEELPDWLLQLREQTGGEALTTLEPEPTALAPAPGPALTLEEPALEPEFGAPEPAEPELTLEPELELPSLEPAEPEPVLAPEPALEPEFGAPEPEEPELTPELELELPSLEPAEPGPEKAPVLDTGLDLEGLDLDQELPEWLQSLDIETEPEAETEPADELDTEKAPEWLSEPAEEPVSTVTVDQMPDWLGHRQDAEEEPAGEPGPVELEPEPTADAEPLEWLRELTGAPEQAAPEPLSEPPVELAEPEPLGIAEPPAPEMPLGLELEPVSEPEPAPDLEPVLAEGPAEPESAGPLTWEPAPQEAGALDASVQQYETLLAGGEVQEGLVAELEEAVQAHPEHAGLQRVLGDAYMRSNQLDQALDAYKKALSKL